MEQQDLRAGTFSSWLVQVEQAQADDAGASVPCGTCTACCTSSQFIHVGPDEVETLTRIPSALLFPAPGRPRGHVLLGYDERGHCPLFADGRCSIYEHRPRTCRAYDCRVLPAAGVEPDEPEQAGIAERTRRWRFDLPTADDRILHQAVQAAAAFLRDHAAELPPGAVPRNPTQLAFLAIKVHDTFLEREAGSGMLGLVHPPLAAVAAALDRAGSIPAG